MYHSKEYMQHWDTKIKVDTHELFSNIMFDDINYLSSDHQAARVYTQKAIMLHMT